MKQIKLSLDKITLLNTMIGYSSENPQLRELVKNITGKVPSRLLINGPNIILIFDEVIDSSSYRALRENLKEMFQEVKVICTPRLRGLLIGLYDDKKRFLGIGILKSLEIKKNSIHIKTAVKNHEEIKYVVFGFLFLNENGEEIGQAKPGVLFV